MKPKKRVAYTGRFSNKEAFSSSITISFIVNCVLIIGVLYGETQGSLHVEGFTYLKFFFWHLLGNTLLYYILFRFNFKVIRSKRKVSESKRMTISATGTILRCLIISPVVTQFQWFVLAGSGKSAPETFILFNFIKDLILGVIVILVTRNMYVSYKREQAIIANQKLMEENIRTRFEALKNQLDPHFLFNSLNTLNGLIGLDDNKAHDYVDNLSSVFRYTLYSKQIRTLDEELNFVEAYVSMLKIRYGGNLTVNYNIAEQYKQLLIMPISIQLLVENAVKHNVISNKQPLTINIDATVNNSIAVSNIVNPKAEKIQTGGVGLANLADRYKILFKKPIRIVKSDGLFTVEVPLVKPNESRILK